MALLLVIEKLCTNFPQGCCSLESWWASANCIASPSSTSLHCFCREENNTTWSMLAQCYIFFYHWFLVCRQHMCIHLTPSIFEMEMFRRYLVFLLPVNYERLKWKSYTHTRTKTRCLNLKRGGNSWKQSGNFAFVSGAYMASRMRAEAFYITLFFSTHASWKMQKVPSTLTNLQSLTPDLWAESRPFQTAVLNRE